MTIHAQYLDGSCTTFKVVLENGDRLGTESGPKEIFIGTAPGNNEYDDLMALQAEGKLTVADYAPPPAGPVVVNAIDFWRRLTDAEGAKVETAMAQQSFVKRRIFETANTFRSDAPEWDLLQNLAVGLFGEARAAELLAPST